MENWKQGRNNATRKELTYILCEHVIVKHEQKKKNYLTAFM